MLKYEPRNIITISIQDGPGVKLYLFRHGFTQFNREKRYLGRSDLPLLEEEYGRICPAPADIAGQEEAVYVSPALRCTQTARLLFPGKRQIPVPEFWEMNFGIFEGRSAREMESDPQYQAWVDSMCEGPVPGGESKAQFAKRVTDRFQDLARQAIQEGRQRLLIVAHGGTQMAVMERFCEQKQLYWTWQTPPGEAVCAWIK